MSKRIYAGNLSYRTSEERLISLFSPYGEVISAKLVFDQDTGQSKGFGFIEMADSANCGRAILELGGKEVDGRKIRINYAEEKKPYDRTRKSHENRPRKEEHKSHGIKRFHKGDY